MAEYPVQFGPTWGTSQPDLISSEQTGFANVCGIHLREPWPANLN